jgi:hypothetical protein
MSHRRGKLISSDEGRASKKQHKTPCSDCPWRRDSVPGWLGGHEPQEFVRLGHNDQTYHCHVITNQQCAGLAIFRANVIKRCDPPNLRLPENRALIFAWDNEFLAHHERELFNTESKE